MNEYLIILMLFAGSFLLTILIRMLARRRFLMDYPNERSSHTVPTPTGGGLAIVTVWFVGLLVLYLADYLEDNLLLAFLGGLILAIVSLVDDIFGVRPIIRLLAQTAAIIMAMYFLGGLDSLEISGIHINTPLLNIVFFLGGLWFINLYNFLDGINGYASVEGIFICLSMYFYLGDNILLSFVAVITGFLFLNFPRARIFMGDIGSTQIGFVLLVLALNYHNQGKFDLILWVCLGAVFWVDATITLYRRFKNYEKLSQAHKKHAYQRIVQAGYSHVRIVLYAAVINLMIFGLNCIGYKFPDFIPVILSLVIVLVYLAIRMVDRLKPFK